MDTLYKRPLRAPFRAGPVTSGDQLLLRGLALLSALLLVVTILFPLYSMLAKSFHDASGLFIGLENFQRYFSEASLYRAVSNSFVIAGMATLISLLLAFLYGYGLTRTCMPFKPLFRVVSLIPLLAPSLLPAISLVYFFGNQGVAKELLMGHSIYGPIGIVLGLVIWVFPSALMILMTSLSMTDARLYEAASVLKAGPIRTFFTVTLPGVKYGLISAAFVVFTLTLTDFGVAKVIGGQYNVLATDLFKQVIGQQNFQMGAVVGLMLLLPAILAFFVDRYARRKQVAITGARAVPYSPKPHALRDRFFLLYCSLIGCLLIAMLGMAAYASFVTFWPYDQTLSLKNYQFDMMDGGGWAAFYNSLQMALLTAVFGTLFIFLTAYVSERCHGWRPVLNLIGGLTLLPMAVPGMVLGLAYIFFFNAPDNPLNGFYGGMTIMVISTIVHYYTVSHLTAVTAIKQMDPEIEAVGASLKVPQYRTFCRVSLPLCLPAVLDISTYLFSTAMTTISAVIFLYSPDTFLASIAMLHMEGAGDIAPSAAMAMVIVLTSTSVRLLHWLLTRRLSARLQRWKGA
ncbi:ABC transporter permease [Marinobacterium nitratireducens]|uniref:ABC transporter permease n=1 Tax=Marinobacterium nitratireducens TaxID=518897 RepID=A0A917Z535_9GAMM|nr:putative 2-aminoethylphosphonate ABC transporter permease subunit [Marinobacterium nitratireducens]GGO75425.1 ABC transporter permease [Marinobacterium nitratireducens]